MKVQIVEVGPRDGLQNENVNLDVSTRAELVGRLLASGLKRIEIGAFVSPKWVPQMANSDQVIQSVREKVGDRDFSQFSVLVPNERGMQDALKSGVREVAVFGSSTESFSQKNINCSISESLERFKAVVTLAKKQKIKVRGYLSTAFGCPYEGEVNPARVVQLAQKYFELGVYELSIGDTIGVATPKQVEVFLQKLVKKVNLKKVALHFHDTRGTALANVLKSLQLGIRVFDASVGGLGGCPYAQGASGNLATEDLVYMLERMNIKTGISLVDLNEISIWMSQYLKKPLPARVSKAGIWPTNQK